MRRVKNYTGRTANKRDERAAVHSITSSAIASTPGGMVSPLLRARSHRLAVAQVGRTNNHADNALLDQGALYPQSSRRLDRWSPKDPPDGRRDCSKQRS
jgi:hypothetical protein